MPKKQHGKSSAASILGRQPEKEVPIKQPTTCVVCLKTIPVARIEALVSMNTPATKYTHVGCSTTTKIKGVYLGEVGTSQIMLVDKLYDDNVRSVFKRAKQESSEDEESNEDDDN